MPPAVRARAARDWCDWEDAVNSLEEGWTPSEKYADPLFRMTFARLCAHYFSHAAWLEDGQLLRDAGRLAGIPGALIHGHFDIGGPPDVPWVLHQAWPGSELHLVRTGHHGGNEMTEHMMTALNRFARPLSERGHLNRRTTWLRGDAAGEADVGGGTKSKTFGRQSRANRLSPRQTSRAPLSNPSAAEPGRTDLRTQLDPTRI